jgi:hypothetical protein
VDDGSQWIYDVDASTGHGFWYNTWTGESYWSDASVDASSYSDTAAVASDVDTVAGSSAWGDADDSQWQWCVDEGSGCGYWYNSLTGESRWAET